MNIFILVQAYSFKPTL